MNTISRYVRLPISPGRIAQVLFPIALLLISISLLGLYVRLFTDYGNLHRYVHYAVDKTSADAEQSIPTFFSVALMLMASALLWFMSVVDADHSAHFLRSRWFALSIIFLGLACDEATSFHELLSISTLHSLAPSSPYLRWSWVLPYGLLSLILFVVYIPFLRALPRRTAGLLVLAGGIYIGGAIGVEMIGSALHVAEGPDSLRYGLVAHLEEFMEMAGLIVFIYGLSDYLMRNQVFIALQPVRESDTNSLHETVSDSGLPHIGRSIRSER